MLTNEQYTANVVARASKDFHTSKMPTQGVIQILATFLAAAEALDVIKKTLYYGNTSVLASDELEMIAQITEMNALEGKINNGWGNMTQRDIDLFHSLLGMATEVGEALYCFGQRMNFLNGHDDENMDEVNMREEFGDIRWYYTLGLYALDTSDEAERVRNDKKLEARYGPAFSADRANNRDLDNERRVLEGENE